MSNVSNKLNMLKFPKRNKFTDEIIKIEQREIEQAIYIKPTGFWYSLGNAWYEWARYMLPEMIYRYISNIEFYKNATTTIGNKDPKKVLVIKTIDDYNEFLKNYLVFNERSVKYYKQKIKRDRMINLKNITKKDVIHYGSDINWIEVAKDFGGIEIHIKPKTQPYMWYRYWDVPSGCVWNTKDIIKSTKVVYKKEGRFVKVA